MRRVRRRRRAQRQVGGAGTHQYLGNISAFIVDHISAASRLYLGYISAICPHRHAPILGSAANEPEAEGPRRVSIARMQNTLMACRHVLRDIREEVRYDIATR